MRPEDAATTIASRFGLQIANPVVLSDSNNLVLWLHPAPVVAKVAQSLQGRLALELSVAMYLKARDAPIVSAAEQVPQKVHHVGGFELTFWSHQPSDDEEPRPVEVARSLFDLHAALLGYPGPLPSFQDELSYVSELLADAGRLETLPEDDRLLLVSAERRFRAELARRDFEEHPLHGSPHSDNMLTVGGKVNFIDFETVCMGPLEWDLAHVSQGVVDAYPTIVDRNILTTCRALVSVKTGTLCWARFEHPALRWHAAHHLQVVKELMAGRTSR